VFNCPPSPAIASLVGTGTAKYTSSAESLGLGLERYNGAKYLFSCRGTMEFFPTTPWFWEDVGGNSPGVGETVRGGHGDWLLVLQNRGNTFYSVRRGCKYISNVQSPFLGLTVCTL